MKDVNMYKNKLFQMEDEISVLCIDRLIDESGRGNIGVPSRFITIMASYGSIS